MLYKVQHSKSEEFIVYRKFNWDRNKKRGAAGFLSVVLMSVGIFMLLPTPEDVISVGWLSRFLVKHYDVAGGNGILYSLVILKGTAALLLVVSIALGGKYVRERIAHKIKNHNLLSL